MTWLSRRQWMAASLAAGQEPALPESTLEVIARPGGGFPLAVPLQEATRKS